MPPAAPPTPADEGRRTFLQRVLAQAREQPVPKVLPEHAALAERLKRLQEGYPARLAEWMKQRSAAAAANAAAAVAAEAAAGVLVGSPRAPPAVPARVAATALAPAATAEAPRPQAEQQAQPFRQVLHSPAGSPRAAAAAAAVGSPIAAAPQVGGRSWPADCLRAWAAPAGRPGPSQPSG